MDFKELEGLHKEYAKNSAEFIKDFTKLYTKWFKKDPRLAVTMTLSLPISVLFNMMSAMINHSIEDMFPELPAVWNRYLSPWIHLRDKWGVVSSEEFQKEWGKLYQAQFDQWFPSEEEKRHFSEWYEDQGKKKAD